MIGVGLKTVKHTDSFGVQSVIYLSARLSLATAGAFHTAYAAIAAEHNDVVSDLELRVLLLMHYLHSWRGGLLDRVPCDTAAFHVLPYDLPILRLAMDAAYLLHFDPPPLPSEDRGEPVKDDHHKALAKRWLKKLNSKTETDYRAGNHDGLVSLMVRFGWTERQALEENSPPVLRELYAYLDASHERDTRTARKRAGSGRGGGVSGEFPKRATAQDDDA